MHAESKDAAKAARKILWTFVEHRAVAGLKSWCSGLQNLCCSDQCRYISLVDLLYSSMNGMELIYGGNLKQ